MTSMCLKVVVHTPSFSSCFSGYSALCMKYCSVSNYFTHALALTIFVTSRKRCNTHTHAFNLSEIPTGWKVLHARIRAHALALVEIYLDSPLWGIGGSSLFLFLFSFFFFFWLLFFFFFFSLFLFLLSMSWFPPFSLVKFYSDGGGFSFVTNNTLSR